MPETSGTTADKEKGLSAKHPGLWRFFKYVISSGTSFVIDNALFSLLFALLVGRAAGFHEIIANLCARAVSSFYNFNINRFVVFKTGGSYGHSLARYYMLCIPQALVSTGLVTLINRLFSNEKTLYATIIKICVDTILFFISYFIQKKWVFSEKKK